ncbi:MAG: winged helix-turn-helix transcriptional regulator [Clostridia bacterium]|nr:winged helix-turn-helix transcriptional regulator [Clostridia bacterium]
MEARFETFTVLINRINRNIRKIKNLEMAEYQLRSPHISCLYYLYTSPGLTSTELCEKCEEDKATVSRSLEYLEANGYLTCQSSRAKRYKSPLALTQKGLDAGGRIAHKIQRVLEEVSAALSEEERLSFYRNLSLVSQSLETVCQQAEKNTKREETSHE